MANEEQRRAFASYMGTASTASRSASQQPAQYPGTYASPGNPYLYQECIWTLHLRIRAHFSQQQFSGVSGLPAAPTPPPAAPSSIASYPSYTGGLQGAYQGAYQGGFPQGGLQQGAYQQNAFPHRPPPLGEGEGLPSQQQAQQHAGQGHSQLSRRYDNQAPPHGYNIGYQYSDPNSHRTNSGGGAMVSAPRNFSENVVQVRSQRVHDRHQQGPVEAPPLSDTVPVLLCHTCSVCGEMRSAGYHRNNPVIPGKPLVLTPCRKCKKRVKSQHRSMSSYTRIRRCTAEEPCDWPNEDVRIDIDQYEGRGRRRSRDTVFVRTSSKRPNIIRQSSSQTRFGLRAFQRESRAPEAAREARIRVSSLSPRRAPRYEGIYPHPDVVMSARSRSMRPPPPTNANQGPADEVWPPPDGVHAHLFRKAEMDEPRRPSSRIVELTPSPPPDRARSTRVVYRSESIERRRRSVSPAQTGYLEERRAADTMERIMGHPRPYRAVHPEERNFRQTSDETSTDIDDLYRARHRRRESPGSILKAPTSHREHSRRRASMRESQQSTMVEIGGPRVHFSSRRETEEPASYSRDRVRYVENTQPRDEGFELNISERRYAEEHAPPIEEMERVRIRRRSPSPRAQLEEEIRIDRARGISPSPSRHVEDVRIRRAHPEPPRSPPSENSRPISGYRHVSREEVVGRAQSITPPRVRRPAEDDVTDSDSAHSGEITEVRTWKGIGENGKPATFVEERRRVRMIEQGSERGSHADFRPLSERMSTRSWRDV